MNGKDASVDSTATVQPHARQDRHGGSRWMVVLLILVTTLFLLRFIAPQTVGEQTRRHLQSQFQSHYVGYDVSIGSGRMEPNTGLIYEDIRIAKPIVRAPVIAGSGEVRRMQSAGQGKRVQEPLLQIDQMVVVTRTDLSRLLEQENPISSDRIVLRGVNAYAWIDEATPLGSMSSEQQIRLGLQSLLPMPKFGKAPCPRIEIHDLTIHLGYANEADNSFNVNVDNVLITNALSTEGGRSTKITATGNCVLADKFILSVKTENKQSLVTAELKDLSYSSRWLDRLPRSIVQHPQVAPLLAQLKTSNAQGVTVTGDLSAAVTLGKNQPLNYAVKMRVHDGAYRHPRTVMALKDLRGVVTCSPGKVVIESGQGYWGKARLNVSGELAVGSRAVASSQVVSSELAASSKWAVSGELAVSAENLLLDNSIASLLTPKLHEQWLKFLPQGIVDVPSSRITLADGKVNATGTVVCKGVDVEFDKFPYPVRHITGTIELREGRIRSQSILGQIGGQTLHCLFDLPQKPQLDPSGLVHLATNAPIAIDAELLEALTPRGLAQSPLEGFVRSLQPGGAIRLVRGTLSTEADGTKHQEFEVDVSDGNMRFERFPYPLYNVAGKVLVKDRLVQLQNFHGANVNGGSITCNGHYVIGKKVAPTMVRASHVNGLYQGPLPNHGLELRFQASRIALDESLRSSLPDYSQQTWSQLSPSGVVDQLDVTLIQPHLAAPIELSIQGKQLESRQSQADMLRLQPVSLPYRLDILDGSVRYENGEVIIDSMRAAHGQSMVSTAGSCRQLTNGRWLLSLDLHSGSRLIPDAELINALPESMRSTIRSLNLRGPFGLSGQTQTLLSSDEFPDPEFGWGVLLQLEGNRIGDVGPVHSLRGELTINGRKNAQGFYADGEVRIDSMHIEDLQITGIRGPYRINDTSLTLGGVPNAPRQGQAAVNPAPIEGRLFGGSVAIRGGMNLSDAAFAVNMSLQNAKLASVLSELQQAKGELQTDTVGNLSAQMYLEGILGTKELLRGNGKAVLSGAKMYELPLLVQLLNVVSITPTEEAAFTNGEAVFNLNEDLIVFEDLKLWGSLIALHGSGMLDGRQDLNLRFDTRVSPRNIFTRVLSPLGDQPYTLWTIDVNGPLNDPKVKGRTLEGVGNTFQQIIGRVNGTITGPGDRGVKSPVPQ